jgi:hypothetical protein
MIDLINRMQFLLHRKESLFEGMQNMFAKIQFIRRERVLSCLVNIFFVKNHSHPPPQLFEVTGNFFNSGKNPFSKKAKIFWVAKNPFL